jgi:hypothetical protein
MLKYPRSCDDDEPVPRATRPDPLLGPIGIQP